MTSPYALDKLMEQTRKLAVEYRSKTGQTLPVGSELALFDLERIFKFPKPQDPELKGIDFIGNARLAGKKIQVKSRVIFDTTKTYRLGQFNLTGDWDYVIFVLYDDTYEVMEIIGLERKLLLPHIDAQNKKGAISVNKFRALGTVLWTVTHGFEI